jgi:hypothetical protein
MNESVWESDIEKALDIAGEGDILVDDVVDRRINAVIDRRNPLWAMLPKRQGQGLNWIVVRRSADGASDWIADTDDPTSVDATFDPQVNFQYRVLAIRGTVTTLLQAAGASFTNVRGQAMASSIDSWGNAAEEAIVQGDNGSNPLEPDGLMQLISGAQTVTSTASGVTKNEIDESIDLGTAFGARFAFMATAQRVRREINALEAVFRRSTDKVEVPGGLRVPTWDSLPIVDSNAVLTNEAPGTKSRIFYIDSDEFFVGSLQPPRPIDLAIDSGTNRKFDIVGFHTHVLAHNKRIAQTDEIVPPP